MKLFLQRMNYKDTFTKGIIYLDDEFLCYTIEDTDRSLERGGEKIYGKTAIPKGKYKLILSMSPRFKKVLPEILDVPGFTGVRIHTGNTSANTEGCIIVGSQNTEEDKDFIGASKIAMDKLMEKLQNTTEDITVEIVLGILS